MAVSRRALGGVRSKRVGQAKRALSDVASVVRMPRPTPLDPGDLSAAVDALPGWSLEGAKLHAEFEFSDFAGAFGFMAAVATVAAQMDHHPEWSNVYSKVTVDLVTHDAGGITELDVELARRMSDLAA